MKNKVLSVAFIFIVALFAVAQDVPKAEVYAGYSFLRVNPSKGVNAFSANGGLSSVQFNFTNHFGFANEFGGYHNGQLSIFNGPTRQLSNTFYSYMFGPRVFFNKTGGVSPFFEFLIGGAHNNRSFSIPNSLIPANAPLPPGITINQGPVNTTFHTSQNALSMAAGGGVDVRLSKMIGFRPIQLDYLPSHFGVINLPGVQAINAKRWQDNLRYSAGIAFRFGGAAPIPPKAACTATPAEVLPWEGPVTASVQTSDFNPKHTLTYDWNSTSGAVSGQGTSASIDPATLTPGNYTVTASVKDPKEKQLNTANCSASFTVKQPRAPQVACEASPSTIHPGDPVTISVQGHSPDLSRIKDRSFSASAGAIKEGQTTVGNQPGEFSTTAVLDTTGVQPGPLNVTVGVTDAHGLSGNCVATANVEALPAPVTVASETLISECDFKNAKKPSRVDNVCKATLDDVALRMQHEPNGKLVVVGFAEEQEEVQFKDVEALRAAAAKAYLTSGEAKQQIDSARIEVRQSPDRSQGQKAQFYFVPEGGTFTVKNTVVVDETQLPSAPAPKKHKAKPQTTSTAPSQ